MVGIFNPPHLRGTGMSIHIAYGKAKKEITRLRRYEQWVKDYAPDVYTQLKDNEASQQ